MMRKEPGKTGRLARRLKTGAGMVAVVACLVAGGQRPGAQESASLRSSPDPKVSRVKADLRSLATAIESYFVDNNTYPAHTLDVRESPDAATAKGNGQADWKAPNFRRKMGPGDPLMTITTPISYLTGYFPDPFGKPKGRTYHYFPKTSVPAGKPDSEPVQGWITWSAGPDGDYDLDWSQYDPSLENPMLPLLDWVYDPTNGATSGGDIMRIKQ